LNFTCVRRKKVGKGGMKSDFQQGGEAKREKAHSKGLRHRKITYNFEGQRIFLNSEGKRKELERAGLRPLEGYKHRLRGKKKLKNGHHYIRGLGQA